MQVEKNANETEKKNNIKLKAHQVKIISEMRAKISD